MYIDLYKNIAADVCSLPKERGPCHNFSVKWYFDITYGGCSRFWYGGCDGNGNQFNSQEECENVCVSPEGPGIIYVSLFSYHLTIKVHPNSSFSSNLII